MKTDELFHKIVNNCQTKRVTFVEPLYFSEGKTFSHRIKIWNTGCVIRNEPEIIVRQCVEGFNPFRTPSRFWMKKNYNIQNIFVYSQPLFYYS